MADKTVGERIADIGAGVPPEAWEYLGRRSPVRSILQPGDHLERYGDAIYLTTPDPTAPKGRRFWYVITVEPVGAPPNVERIVSVEGFDPLKHDHH